MQEQDAVNENAQMDESRDVEKPVEPVVEPLAGLLRLGDFELFDKEYKSLTISGSISAFQWTRIYACFLNLIQNNNIEIDVRVKAYRADRRPINDVSSTFNAINDLVNRLGLVFEKEELTKKKK